MIILISKEQTIESEKRLRELLKQSLIGIYNGKCVK